MTARALSAAALESVGQRNRKRGGSLISRVHHDFDVKAHLSADSHVGEERSPVLVQVPEFGGEESFLLVGRIVKRF